MRDDDRDIDDVRARFRGRALDAGLVVERVWEEVHDGRRLVLATYLGKDGPDQQLGFWWDVDAEPGFPFTDAAEVATYLKIWLEEAFHAGPPVEDMPRDADGLRWVCPAVDAAALPPGR